MESITKDLNHERTIQLDAEIQKQRAEYSKWLESLNRLIEIAKATGDADKPDQLIKNVMGVLPPYFRSDEFMEMYAGAGPRSSLSDRTIAEQIINFSTQMCPEGQVTILKKTELSQLPPRLEYSSPDGYTGSVVITEELAQEFIKSGIQSGLQYDV